MKDLREHDDIIISMLSDRNVQEATPLQNQTAEKPLKQRKRPRHRKRKAKPSMAGEILSSVGGRVIVVDCPVIEPKDAASDFEVIEETNQVFPKQKGQELKGVGTEKTPKAWCNLQNNCQDVGNLSSEEKLCLGENPFDQESLNRHSEDELKGGNRVERPTSATKEMSGDVFGTDNFTKMNLNSNALSSILEESFRLNVLTSEVSGSEENRMSSVTENEQKLIFESDDRVMIYNSGNEDSPPSKHTSIKPTFIYESTDLFDEYLPPRCATKNFYKFEGDVEQMTDELNMLMNKEKQYERLTDIDTGHCDRSLNDVPDSRPDMDMLSADSMINFAFRSPPISHTRQHPIDRGVRLITSGSSVEVRYPDKKKIDAQVLREMNERYIQERDLKREYGSLIHHRDFADLEEGDFETLFHQPGSTSQMGELKAGNISQGLEKGPDTIRASAPKEDFDPNRYDLELPTSLQSGRNTKNNVTERKVYELYSECSGNLTDACPDEPYLEYLQGMDDVFPSSSSTSRNHFYNIQNRDDWIKSLNSAFSIDDDLSSELKKYELLEPLTNICYCNSGMGLESPSDHDNLMDDKVSISGLGSEQKTATFKAPMTAGSLISYTNERIADLFHKLSARMQTPGAQDAGTEEKPNEKYRSPEQPQSTMLNALVSGTDEHEEKKEMQERFLKAENGQNSSRAEDMYLFSEFESEPERNVGEKDRGLGVHFEDNKTLYMNQDNESLKEKGKELTNPDSDEDATSAKAKGERSNVQSPNFNLSSDVSGSLNDNISSPGTVTAKLFRDYGNLKTPKESVSLFQEDNEKEGRRKLIEENLDEVNTEISDVPSELIEEDAMERRPSTRITTKQLDDGWKLNNNFVNSDQKPPKRKKTMKKMILSAISKDSSTDVRDYSKLGWTRSLLNRSTRKPRVHSTFRVDSGESLQGFAAEYANKNELCAPKASEFIGIDAESARKMILPTSNPSHVSLFTKRFSSIGSPVSPSSTDDLEGAMDTRKSSLKSVKEYVATPAPVVVDDENSCLSTMPGKKSILRFAKRNRTLDANYKKTARTTSIRFAASPEFMTTTGLQLDHEKRRGRSTSILSRNHKHYKGSSEPADGHMYRKRASSILRFIRGE